MNLPIRTGISFAWLDKKNWTVGSVYEQMEEESRKVVLGPVINSQMIKLQWWGYHKMRYSQHSKQWNETLSIILDYKLKDNLWEHDESIKQRIKKGAKALVPFRNKICTYVLS